MKKIFILSVVLLLNSIPANAEPDSLYLHVGGFSKHFEERGGNRGDYNEVNNNIGLEYESNIGEFEYFKGNKILGGDIYFGGMVQFLENSVDQESFLVGFNAKKKWDLSDDGKWELGAGLFAGAQNGYPNASEDRTEDEFIPVAYPFVEVNYNRFGVYGTCVPEVAESGFCFVGFKVKAYEFK